MEATRHKLIMDAMSQDHACGGHQLVVEAH